MQRVAPYARPDGPSGWQKGKRLKGSTGRTAVSGSMSPCSVCSNFSRRLSWSERDVARKGVLWPAVGCHRLSRSVKSFGCAVALFVPALSTISTTLLTPMSESCWAGRPLGLVG